MRLIFKEIEYAVFETKERIALLGSEQGATKMERRLKLLMRIVGYVNSMAWVSHAKLATKVRVFLQSRYRYEQVAVEFGISIKQAHKSISYAGQCLRRIIGGTLLLIYEDRLDGAEREFEKATGIMDSSIFAPAITDRFKPRKSAGVVLSDCRKEIHFLLAFSQRHFETLADSVRDESIQHLLHILLSTDSTYLRERAILSDCIVAGTLSVDECIRALNGECIWGRMRDRPVSGS